VERVEWYEVREDWREVRVMLSAAQMAMRV
jgi:hypothetical protein